MVRPLFILVFVCLFLSCEKIEQPVRLPEGGTSHYSEPVNMGEDYYEQLFYDLTTNKVVYTSLISSWDLAFETSPDGFHVYINAIKYVAHNTQQKDITHVTQIPALKKHEWRFDASTGLPDSTVIGNWRDANGLSKNDVYVLKYDTNDIKTTYKKLQIASVTGDEYIISSGDLESPATQVAHIPKDQKYNFTYYSFADGIVYPEPHKESWDLVFTRYCIMFWDLQLPYKVVGVLLNPYKTSAALLDTTVDYSLVNVDVLDTVKLSNHRDVIGYDWKSYNIDKSLYTVNKKKVYIINDRNNLYYKLRFLDFYNPETGKKGSPSFEFERLQ